MCVCVCVYVYVYVYVSVSVDAHVFIYFGRVVVCVYVCVRGWMGGWVLVTQPTLTNPPPQSPPPQRYIVTGFFDSQPLEKQLANVECNATAAVALTHHFVGELIKARTA